MNARIEIRFLYEKMKEEKVVDYFFPNARMKKVVNYIFPKAMPECGNCASVRIVCLRPNSP